MDAECARPILSIPIQMEIPATAKNLVAVAGANMTSPVNAIQQIRNRMGLSALEISAHTLTE
jgi:hypothetical protein